MKALARLTAAASVVALACGCSSGGASSGGASTGGASSGGASTGGASSGGSAGATGCNNFPATGARACDSCLKNFCCSEESACLANACVNLLTCISQNCSGASDLNACIQQSCGQYTGAMSTLNALGSCDTSNCSTPCNGGPPDAGP